MMKTIRMTLSSLGLLRLFFIVSIFPTAALAQANYTAQVRGVVQDTTNAVVPRATVTITNDGTQVPDKTTTDEMGRYIFNGLAPASYTMKVEVSGFKTVVRSNVVLRVGQQIDLDFTLQLGEITSTVEVTAESTMLNSVSAALGTEVTNRYIIDMHSRAEISPSYRFWRQERRKCPVWVLACWGAPPLRPTGNVTAPRSFGPMAP
jgi:carboxypeptidase family protein